MPHNVRRTRMYDTGEERRRRAVSIDCHVNCRCVVNITQDTLEECQHSNNTLPPLYHSFTDMTLRARSTVPAQYGTDSEHMQQGGVDEHVVQNLKIAEEPAGSSLVDCMLNLALDYV